MDQKKNSESMGQIQLNPTVTRIKLLLKFLQTCSEVQNIAS